MTRPYPKPFRTKAPPTSSAQRSRRLSTKPSAQIDSSECINSRLSYDRSSSSSESSYKSPATPRILRSAIGYKKGIPVTPHMPDGERKKSLRSVGTVEVVFYRSGELVSPEEAKRRKRGEVLEDMKVVESDESDSLSKEMRRHGALTPRKGHSLDCSSTEIHGKRKRSEKASSGSLTFHGPDSGYESGNGKAPKLARVSSPAYRAYDSSMIKNRSEQRRYNRTKTGRFSKNIREIRTPPYSSESSETMELRHEQTSNGTQAYEKTIRKGRSRSPPRDRDGSESSAESRYNCDGPDGYLDILVDPNEVEDISRDTSTEMSSRVKEDGKSQPETIVPPGRDLRKKQYQLPDSRPTQLKTRRASSEVSTRSSPMPEKQASQIIYINASNCESISYILITPPSSEAGDAVLDSHREVSCDILATETKSDKACRDVLFSLALTPILCADTGKLPAKTRSKMKDTDGDDQDDEFILPPPLLSIEVVGLTEHAYGC